MLGKNEDFDLEERFINFAVRIIRAAESLPETVVGKHIGGQSFVQELRRQLTMVKIKARNPVLISSIK